MSIFASTSGPSLISIPTFTSPVHPQTQPTPNDSTLVGGSPTKALSRAEERQKRFRNGNTQWDSLTRVIEQQKANNSQSLLQLIGGSSTLPTATGGKGKGKEVERRKSTRGGADGTNGTSKDVPKASKSPSPQKRKRETSKSEGKSETAGVGGGKRSKEDDDRQKATNEAELGSGKEGERSSRGKKSESKSTNSLAAPVQPLASSSAPFNTSNDPITTAPPPKARGRAPRAAMRRTLETTDSVPSTSNYLVPPSRSPPRSPPIFSPTSVSTSYVAPLDNSKPVEAPKKRRNPRAAPPTPAASRHRNLSPEPEHREIRDVSIEVIPDSQVEVDTGSKGGNAREETGVGSKKAVGQGKKRKVVPDPTADDGKETAKESSPKKKKIKVVKKTKSESKVPVERGDHQEKAIEASNKKGATTKAQQKELTKIEASTTEKKGKKAKEVIALSSSPPSSPRPAKKVMKRSKPVVPPPPPSSSPVHSSALSFDRSSVPPLLSSLANSKANTTKSKAKQHLVRSERLETDHSKEGKVNVYDVIIGGAKSVLRDTLADLDEDDETDQPKIQALKQYVATFRLSLLHRSADLSEYSAMQRKLTTAKARSKKLKAELEELKREKKGK